MVIPPDKFEFDLAWESHPWIKSDGRNENVMFQIENHEPMESVDDNDPCSNDYYDMLFRRQKKNARLNTQMLLLEI